MARQLLIYVIDILNTINKTQESRFAWLLMSFICLGLVCFSHFVLQMYLFMQPCEQCVYIRYAFVVIGIGGIVASIYPKCLFFRLAGYVISLYGGIRGIMFSLTLNRIHKSIHSDEMVFNIGGCSLRVHFDFSLPLDVLIPALFKPIGDCGYDSPVVPSDVLLEGFRALIASFYADGFYLIPSLQFGSMAQCCFVVFGVCLVALVVMLCASLYNLCNNLYNSICKHSLNT